MLIPRDKGVTIDPASGIELTGETPRFALDERAVPKANNNKPKM
jgi:hypothetical protein